MDQNPPNYLNLQRFKILLSPDTCICAKVTDVLLHMYTIRTPYNVPTC